MWAAFLAVEQAQPAGMDRGEDDPDFGPRTPGSGIVPAVERLGGSAVHIPAAQARKGARTCRDNALTRSVVGFGCTDHSQPRIRLPYNFKTDHP